MAFHKKDGCLSQLGTTSGKFGLCFVYHICEQGEKPEHWGERTLNTIYILCEGMVGVMVSSGEGNRVGSALCFSLVLACAVAMDWLYPRGWLL